MFSKQVWLTLVFAAALPLAAQDVAQTQIATKPICQPAAFTVAARASKTCTFTIPSTIRAARLVGHFTATGGPRNTIEVWVLDDDSFVNWQNAHQVHALYNSQKVTTGTIGLFLHPGTYHVIFNNSFSVLTPKAVEANMALEYKAPQMATN